MQLQKRWLAMLVLTALFLSSLTGCYGSAPPKPVKVCPPGTLQQERPIPAWSGRTWGDLAAWSEALAGTWSIAWQTAPVTIQKTPPSPR